MGLVLIHLPVPHPPAIYDRHRGVVSAEGKTRYIDSVSLADRTLGLLRHALEDAGLWDRTALLVTADHGWRVQMWRGDAEWTPEEEIASHTDTSGPPFILRLPGKNTERLYAKPFNTLVTREIIVGILKGTVTASSQLPTVIESAKVASLPAF
jgi:arylsulfatase A-like enzyme